MAFAWAATSPSSGRFVPVEIRSGLSKLTARFEELRACGTGYLEIRFDEDYPMLTMAFRERHAVVHFMRNSEETLLLVGDEAAAPDVVEVPVMDELVEFSGEFVLSVDRAWQVVHEFLDGRDLMTVRRWYEL